MTYCVGAMVDEGLVLASDSRSNAGVDHVARVRKMMVYERAGERVIVIMCSGNLGVTQAVVSMLDQRGRQPGGIWSVPSLHDAAALVGEALREVQHRDGHYLQQHNIDGTANFLVAGEIAGDAMGLIHVYPEGNFIAADTDTPHLIIGETKLGKAIIDRVISAQTGLADAAKCVLVSFDYTMRGNISVGLPIDLICYRRGSLRVETYQHLVEEDAYFDMIHRQWGERLRRAIAEWPDPDWKHANADYTQGRKPPEI